MLNPRGFDGFLNYYKLVLDAQLDGKLIFHRVFFSKIIIKSSFFHKSHSVLRKAFGICLKRYCFKQFWEISMETKNMQKNKNVICSVWARKSRTKSCEFQHLDHSSYGNTLVLVFRFSKFWGTRKDKRQKNHKKIILSINFERNVHFSDGSLWSRRFCWCGKYHDPKNISFICKAISLYT